MSEPRRLVYLHVVTFNNATTILPCLEAALRLELPSDFRLKIVVTDNASSDETVKLLKEHLSERIQLKQNTINNGFTGAHNAEVLQAVNEGAAYVFLLNPDLVLEPQALRHLITALEQDTSAGIACPKLLRADESLKPVSPPTFDAAGMYITPAIRHFDRGSGRVDCGQYERSEYVFGASGAALLIRADCIRDTSLPESEEQPATLFDDAFFAYREDADLAWRAQLLGWKCRYEPKALGYHVRKVLPERRRDLPAELNAYSVRNRFLLQANNLTPAVALKSLNGLVFRNLVVILGAATIERSSRTALSEALRELPRALARRRQVLKRRRTGDLALSKWFQHTPYAEPALCSEAGERIQSITAVIVNYNSGQRLSSCLKDLLGTAASLQSVQLRIVVVDNASEDESLSLAEALPSGSAELVFERMSTNLGFAGAINHAAANHPADAYLVLNPDISVDASCVEALATGLTEHRDLGLIAPVLVNADGSVQHGFAIRRFPTLGGTLAELFFLHRLWPNNPWTSQYLLKDDDFLHRYLEARLPSEADAPRESLELPLLVEQPAAACVLIRGKAFETLGGFDADFYPAWFEDVDFCRRLYQKNLFSAVLTKARAVHEGGYSKKSIGERRFLKIWYRNMLRYWNVHGTRFERAILGAAVPIAYLIRTVANRLKR